MRGLKLSILLLVMNPAGRIFYRCVDWNTISKPLRQNRIVASFTDAWIETKRGTTTREIGKSHLLQMRGLKPSPGGVAKKLLVASFTDAWIETVYSACVLVSWTCRIFYRCVDWNLLPTPTPLSNLCRIFYRCVDWNVISHVVSTALRRRIFYRCVDWNLQTLELLPISLSRIFYRCVDWNSIFCLCFSKLDRRIFYRCVDWNYYWRYSPPLYWSHLLQMRGLKHVQTR